ncbi:MAG: Fe-S cluster assembly protein SufD [Nitrosomonadaceae bacterium]|nr:Fe-S cluster assembly protein SufD [Nitrosomonadaceae bacterium]
MSVGADSKSLKNLLQGQSQLSASPLDRVNQLRTNAVNQVNILNLPTKHDEDWRFTDISPLTKISFQPVREASPLKNSDVEHFYLTEAVTRLVFIDGIYAPHLSTQIAEPFKKSGVVVSSLAAASSENLAAIESHLGYHTELQDNIFAALNTSFLHEGALIIVPRNISVETPIHLLFIATQKEVSSHPRCLLIAEPNSRVTVIEDYVTLREETYITNTVAEFALADSAHVNHVRIQRDSKEAFHIANCSVSLAQKSNYQSVSIAFGARISRYNLNVLLKGEGAECTADGLALISNRQLADTHACIDHIKPHCTSHQLHKCIIDDAAHAVFNGKIIVRPDAQLTNSTQSNRNLLLTSKARIDTKPQLEIFADDVKCAHGATIGQLDNEEIFYLKSRGLSEVTARDLLTYAFGAEVIERIPVASLKLRLEQVVHKQTQRD